MTKKKYDFAGWATKNDLRCADGRTIRKDAFKDQDGQDVPLVWNHDHNAPENVLGLAHLENRPDGVYAYCNFNSTESGEIAKKLVREGNIRSLSIYANQLKQKAGDVTHGVIREVSLVLAGANPGAFIDTVMSHGQEDESSLIIGYDEGIVLYHSAEHTEDNSEEDKKETEEKMAKEEQGKTIGEIFETLTEEQKKAVYAIVGAALEEQKEDDEDDEEDEKMNHNVFEQDSDNSTFLSHGDQENIIKLAKNPQVGTLQSAIEQYFGDTLQHGFDDIDYLFPDYKDLKPGAPDILSPDYGWVGTVINGVHKSPISRIRTKQTDTRVATLTGKGYKKGNEKSLLGNAKLLKRTTDPQFIYVKDKLNREDIVDITDFDVVSYQFDIMRNALNEKLAIAIMIGDGLEEGDDDKISQEHIRSIWHDDDLYTIHKDVDFASVKKELQGTNTSANFGENYLYAEAVVQSALYARENYKGSGSPVFICAPHLLNVMLLARDLNGHRIYDSVSDLAKALNVSSVVTAEQFDGLTRTTADAKTKKLLGIMVNLADYTVGATKGGEITKFNQFNLDFNQEKLLLETRVSGALNKAYSAIALEEDVTA